MAFPAPQGQGTSGYKPIQTPAIIPPPGVTGQGEDDGGGVATLPDPNAGPDPFAPPSMLDQGQVPPDMAGMAATAAELLKDDPQIIEPGSLLLAEDPDILKTAFSRMMRSTAFRAPFETRWHNAWLDWMLFLRGDAKAWQSRVKIPLTYSQVSSAIPNFIAAIYDSGPLFDVEGMDEESDKNSRTMRDMIEWFLRSESPSERQAADWIKYAMIFGTGVMKAYWKRVEGIERSVEVVQIPMPDGQMLSSQTRIKNTFGAVLQNRPVLACVDLWNFFPPTTMDDDFELDWAFERVESSVEALRNDAQTGLFGMDGVARVEDWLTTRPEAQASVAAMWNTANTRASSWGATNISSPYTAEFQTDEGNDRKHAQIVYWLMTAKDYRIVISGDGGRVLGKMPNPYNHGKMTYVLHWFDRIPKCPFGRGVGEVLEAIQRQIDFNYNKGNDAAQLAINAPIKLRGAGNAGVQTVWQPGVIVKLRDTTDLEPLVIKNPMGEVAAMNNDLMAHADKATGLNDLSRGSAVPGVNTATEANGVQAQFRMRMSGHARELRVSMSRLGNLIVSMIQQFVDAPQAIKVTGQGGLDWQGGPQTTPQTGNPDTAQDPGEQPSQPGQPPQTSSSAQPTPNGAATWTTVSPSQLVGKFRVTSTVSFSKSNPSMIRQDLLAAAPIVSIDPMVNHHAWLMEFFKGFGFEHPERFVMPPPPPLRNPAWEQQCLDLGIDVDPSPDEIPTGMIDAHMQQYHLPALQAYMANPTLNPKGLAATLKHVQKTMGMASALQMGGPGGGAGGPPGTGSPKKPGQGNETRSGATRLGQASGSDGPPGASPGPSAPPGRPMAGARA